MNPTLLLVLLIATAVCSCTSTILHLLARRSATVAKAATVFDDILAELRLISGSASAGTSSAAPVAKLAPAPRPPQAGFIRGRVLVVLSGLGCGCAVALALVGCSSWWKGSVQPVVNNVIDCSKAEAQLETQGKSIIQITVDVLNTVGTAIAAAAAQSADPASAVEAALGVLYAKWGQPIVACVLHKSQPTPTSSSRRQLTPAQVVVDTVIANHGWQFAH